MVQVKFLLNTFLLAVALALIACSDEPNTESVASAPASSRDTPKPEVKPQSQAPAEPKFIYECPDDQLTLADFCLGMPLDQVKAALSEKDQTFDVSERMTSFNYSDGAQKLRTEAFVSELRAEATEGDDYFEFWFTAPPDKGQLVRMLRSMGSEANLPALAPFIAALVDRYGEPDYNQRGQSGNITSTMRWDFPAGNLLCADAPKPDKNVPMALSRVNAVRYGQNIDYVLDQLGVDDPARCANWLQVHIQTFAEDQPVRSVEMQLDDFSAAVEAGKKTNAWLVEMEANAKAERLKNAEVPDL